jgi:ATP-dependent 26S proteasome regulatory subunit
VGILAQGGEEFIKKLEELLGAGYPLVWVFTREEQRAMRLIGSSFAFWTYEPLGGTLRRAQQDCGSVSGFEEALEGFLEHPEARVLVVLGPDRKDLLGWALRVRTAYPELLSKKKALVVVSDLEHPPRELERFAVPTLLPSPGVQDLLCLLEDALKGENTANPLVAVLDEDVKGQACLVLKGLLEHEALLAFRLALSTGKTKAAFLQTLAREKVRAFKRSGALSYVEPAVDISKVGGLDRFKDWLVKRKPLFFHPPEAAGELLVPKGVLLMGVAGTGKSLCAKVAANIFELPLLRLELSALFAQSDQESPDTVFLRTIDELENLEPCVLWVDEIEKGFVSGIDAGGSSSSRISASFLTWMQERRSRIFVVATANRIMMLPAEILRRGRFDDVFFLDLPDFAERKEIFRIQLERFGINPSGFDAENLAESGKGISGAEIEQVVKQALIEGLAEAREVSEADIYRSIGSFVPLSVTMFEQIKAIKKWAHDRAIPASSSTRF